jgi:hypothetical protein
MRKKRHGEESIERLLATAYRNQPSPEPSELWHQRVMQAVRGQGSVLSIIPTRPEMRIVWRAACVAVAAAIIMAVLGFWILPSDARLAWQFQREGAVSAWLLQMGD